jgi:CheY-like chemotaxis protein
VDNKHAKNALIVDRLRGIGVSVLLAGSTVQALTLVKQHDFDIVITDMHRRERANDGFPSGIRLIAAMRGAPSASTAGGRPSIILYCAKRSLLTYGKDAEAKGADFVTSSEVELLGTLARFYPSLF